MSVHHRSSPIALAVALALAMIAPRLAAQARADRGSFIVRLGKDTLAAERYSRTPTRLTGQSVVRSPTTIVRSYTVTFDGSGNLTRYEVSARRAGASPGAPPLQRALFTPMRDSVKVEIHADSDWTMMVAAPRGTLPLMNLGYGVYELALERARAAGQDSVAVPMLFIGGKEVTPVIVKRIAHDSLSLETPFGIAWVKTDGVGHIVRLYSPGSTQQVTVERVPTVNVSALATAFADHGMGQLSPRDTVRATVAGASLMVDYSRPAKRGRVIFGNVVPWNQVWRLGANAATTFVTDKDIMLGGSAVPAGTYTLFSLPSESGWKLIVSRKTGEWGTEYDPSADLARIDMESSKLAQPVEQFTVSIEPQGSNAGVMRFAWDDTEVRVPVSAPSTSP